MGEVYLAVDPHIERRLAIKTVRLTGRPQELEDRSKRLLREARAAGRLLHPNIVTLFDAGEVDGLLYLAFEFVEGSDLSVRMVAPPPLTMSQVLGIVRQAADALDYAHQQGIVHRDIKPSNIMLDPAGRVKVADFGIAKVVGQSTELTMAGSVMGSPQYLSPEQIRGEDLDGRSDLFSLGVVLYELLSGRRPFDGETITTLVYQILHKEPPTVSELRGGIPPRLEKLLEQMLAKDKAERLASAGLAAEELAAIARELPHETLAGPAATDGQAVVPTYQLPRRTTVAAQMPQPLPGAPPPPPPPAQPAVAPPPAMADPSRGPKILLALFGAFFLLAAFAGGWWFLSHRGAESAAMGTEAGLGTEGTEAQMTPPTLPAQPPGTTPGPAEQPAAPGAVTSPANPATPPSGTIGNAPVRPAPGSNQPLNPQLKPPVNPQLKPPANQPSNRPETVPPTSRPPVPSPAPPTHPSVPAPSPPEEEEPAPAPRPAASRSMRAGMSLTFQVTPPDAFVLVDGTVIGPASQYSGKKGSQVYTFADAGDHLIKLRKPGMKDLLIAVDAGAVGGTTPLVASLQSVGSADVSTSDLESYEVREAIALRVTPPEAEVTVDGRAMGPASKYAGRFGHSNEWLELSPGKHRIGLAAPGYRSKDIAVDATGGAEKARMKVEITLVRGGG